MGVERFICPYCTKPIYINKVVIALFWVLGKDYGFRCPYCGERWFATLFIHSWFQFYTGEEVNSEIWCKP